ncbi:hypothetical protein [Stenotrophomonas maltophilia]|uniref:hypothetical protein n=1 Tax=Stenotrophomonas maltophilia TaxID=40324 RepID=UPI0012DB4654|nr:hypothetical protein [Stenotrophomonas maltophilia]
MVGLDLFQVVDSNVQRFALPFLVSQQFVQLVYADVNWQSHGASPDGGWWCGNPSLPAGGRRLLEEMLMARRHLINPREGEGKGHGREIRELRALRNQVRDLQRQVDDLSAWRVQQHEDSMRTETQAPPAAVGFWARVAALFPRGAQ